MDRPFEKDSLLQLLKIDNEEAQQVFWHSSAHMLGEAMERIYGGCLCYGPPIDGGFYYDMFIENKGVFKINKNIHASINMVVNVLPCIY